MKRKRKIFPTREAYRAWLESREALERELRAHVARIDAELAARTTGRGSRARVARSSDPTSGIAAGRSRSSADRPGGVVKTLFWFVPATG